MGGAKVSIIVPTYKHLDTLRECLESIVKFTNLEEVEVLVVANGCGDDGTREYVESLGKPFRLLWLDEPSGYTKSTNYGIERAYGDFVVLLNNDTVLLPQEKNAWIEMLTKPLEDKSVGITGPMKVHCPYADRDFLIFFCVCMRRELFEELGLLDEIYNPGFGEDTDFSIKAVDKGYRLVQVPGETDSYYSTNRMTGGFPIFHEGEVTFRDVADGNDLLKRNHLILASRYRKELRLNLGSGDAKLPGYLNIDLYNNNADFKLDVRDLSVFKDNSVDEITAIALFEHLSPFEVPTILREWARVLKPDGKLVMEMPNILEICKSFDGADRWKRYELINSIYGTTQQEHPHLFGWYPEILTEHLISAGFSSVKFLEPTVYHWGINMRVEATPTDYWQAHQIEYGNNYERYVAGAKDSIQSRERVRYEWANANLSGKTLLDIGCSSGYGSRLLKNVEYTGFDYDRKVLEFAKREFPQHRFFKIDLEQEPIEGHWDTIVCFECLEHLSNGKELAQELKNHCNTLLCTVPYKEEVGYWGPHHKLHGLSEVDFPDFEHNFLHNYGSISDEPDLEQESIDLMIMKWQKS